MEVTQAGSESAGSVAATYKAQIVNLLDNVDPDDVKFFKQIYTIVNTHIRKRNYKNNQGD